LPWTLSPKPIAARRTPGPAVAGLVLGFILLILAGVALADADADEARFEKLGRAKFMARQYDDAIAAFEAAYDINQTTKYLYNIALAYQKKNEFERALEYVERYRQEATDPSSRRDGETLRKLLSIKLKNVKGEVRIASQPAEALAKFRHDDKTVASGLTPYIAWVPHGTYRLEIIKKGYETFWKDVTVSGEKRVFVNAELRKAKKPKKTSRAKAAPKAASARSPATKAVPPAGDRSSAVTWLPWAVLGGGAALVVGGGVLGVLSGQAVESRDDLVAKAEAPGSDVTLADIQEQDDAAQSRALGSNVLLGLGGATVAAGAVLWLLQADVLSAGAVEAQPGGIRITWGGAP